MPDQTRRRTTFNLKLSKIELVHLRDLFSIVLATDAGQTVSQGLAAAEDRAMVEAKLWQRVATVCREASIELDEDAPDFVCAAMPVAPPVGVYRLAHEPGENGEDS